MAKKYANCSLVYTLLAMVFGVFYREFTKFSNFTGDTRLSVVHTHYFMLGMVFFLIAMLVEKNYTISQSKKSKLFFITYNIGLNITALMLFARGLVQVTMNEVPKGLDASISGIGGLGHIVLGVGIICFFLALREQLKRQTTG